MELIDKREVLSIVGISTLSVNQVVNAISAMTPIEAQPIIHAKWNDFAEAGQEEHDSYWRFWCSNCHNQNWKESIYCPNCGAKMVEPQESEVGDDTD